MPLGQINPLNFVVAHRLASNQSVDSSTATRHALVGTLLGEGLLGPVIARQLAIRDAAATPAPVDPGAKPLPAATPLDTIATNLKAWTSSESKRDEAAITHGKSLIEEAEKRKTQRTDDLRLLCKELGALEGYESAPDEMPAHSGTRKKPG